MPNISETLAKAREAGMSYGQYVALHDTAPPVKISEQKKREQKIIDLYNKNYTLQAIQHAMHMSQDSIKAVLDKNQIERRSRTNWINSAFEENRSEIEQLCKEGKSISFIANKFGFSFGTLKKRLDKEGIKRARPYKFNITKEELRKLLKDRTHQEVAQITGYSAQVINKYVIQYGLQKRKNQKRKTQK